MPTSKKKQPLGKGLAALFKESGESGAGVTPGAGEAHPSEETPRDLPVSAMLPNPSQPRSRFDDAALKDLAASIADSGVIQPILVRPAGSGMYEIVAGERRWRAAQMAGVARLPVVVRDLDDAQALQNALVENLQRVDLNAIEEAKGYEQLQHSLGCTQDALAKRVGKSRPHVANSMRLLKLPDEVLKLVEEGDLTAGQVRPLVGHPQARSLALRIRRQGLTAQQAEQLAAGSKLKLKGSQTVNNQTGRDPDIAAIEDSLSAALGAVVRVSDKGAKGEIRIRYDNLEEFDRLNGLLSKLL